MSEPSTFSPAAQQYLDGQAVSGKVNPAEHASADRLLRAIEAYAARLRTPGPELDAAVMRRVRAEAKAPRFSWWSWLVTPHVIRVRPAVPALAASLALVVWWAASGPRAPVDAGAAAPLGTVLVRFQLAAPDAHDVSVSGSFNGWTAPGIALRRSVVPGLWVVTLPLPVGEHQYLFRVDRAQWVPDPGAHAQVDDGFGRTNSVLVVGPRGVAGP
ncbi:MAG: glycoside hydrolase family 13 [Gemmatimonadetes bacterium]|nr:glycoside hydrolase family 13 [Gemmatimonadota bacterium]MBI2535803.1 glycoside hydrolase family 13 [Gemmatimonadota bacterium]MBI2614249.1 glycoside hydrolase family 13 [Gemmatimonadota bacterium]